MNKKVLILSFILVACFTTSSFGAYMSPSLVSVQYVDSGKRLFDNKDYDRAIIDFNKALLADPKNENALLYLRMLGFGRGGCPSFAKNCPNREQGCGVTGSCKAKSTTGKVNSSVTAQKNKPGEAKTSSKTSKVNKPAVAKSHAKSQQKEKAALKKIREASAQEEEQFFKSVNAEQKTQQSPKGKKKNKKQKGQALESAAAADVPLTIKSTKDSEVPAGIAQVKSKAGSPRVTELSDDESARSLGAIVVRKDAPKGIEDGDDECCDEKMSSGKEMSYEDCVANCKKLKTKPASVAKETKSKQKKQTKAKKNKKSAKVNSAIKAGAIGDTEISEKDLEAAVNAEEGTGMPRGTMKAGMTMKASDISNPRVSTSTSDDEEFETEMSSAKTIRAGSGIESEESAEVSMEASAPETAEDLAQRLEPTLTKKQKYQLAKIRARNATKERDTLRRLNAQSTEQEQQEQEVRWNTKTTSLDPLTDDETGGQNISRGHGRVRTALADDEESLAAKNAELREKMNDMLAMSKHDQDVIESLQGNTKSNDDEVTRLRNDLAQTRERLDTRRTLIKDQTEKLRSLQDRLGALEMDVHSRQYDFKDKQLDYDKQIADLEGEFGEYKLDRAKNETEFKDHLKTLKDALAQKIAELDAAQEKLLFTEYKLKKRDSQYVSKNNQFDEVKKTLSDLEDRLSGLQGTMDHGDTDVAAIDPDQFPPPQTKEEAVYQRWIQRHDKLIAKLKEKLMWAREQMDFLGEYDIKLSDQKMAVLKEQLAELKKQLSEKGESSSTRSEDQSLMESRLKDAQERLGMVEKILKEKDEQIQELEKQLNGALSAIE